VSQDAIRAGVREYYESKLRLHGPTPLGVDWNSRESQELRFVHLARLWEGDPHASILDYGCGYGALAPWLRGRGHQGGYTGFDLSPDMIAQASRMASHLHDVRFTADRAALEPFDYAVASGIFNVKMDTPDERWLGYVLASIADLASLSRRGFAFNVLTRYSDPEKRRPDLFYANPLELFDHCQRTCSRFVTLVHDYPLYEFTLIVRHQPPWPSS
jgi:SAM-dependent methyltransferase